MSYYVTRKIVKEAQPVSNVRQRRLSGDSSIGFGQEYEPVDILSVVKDLHRGYTNVEPLTDFIGEHPWLTFTLFFLSVIAGGAAGGYIGAGLKVKG